MKTLVVGYGSIGKRHCDVLGTLGAEVAVVSRRPVDLPHVYAGLQDAVRNFKPAYVVIASRTSEHHADLTALATCEFSGRVLVEKPLYDVPSATPTHAFEALKVAYNLRFHPALRRLHELLEGKTVLSAVAYVGSYLPDWRPGRDYRNTGSAKSAFGGGALRELSHELDYVLWTLGAWRRVTSIGGHLSTLELDTDDLFILLMETERCPAVSVQVNFLDTTTRRYFRVLTNDGSYQLDLIAKTLETPNGTEKFDVDANDTYRHEHLAMMKGDYTHVCDYDEGAGVAALIQASEIAAKKGVWIKQ